MVLFAYVCMSRDSQVSVLLFRTRRTKTTHPWLLSGRRSKKFRLEPELELARKYRLSAVQLKEIEKFIEAHYDDLKTAWKDVFGS